jgi:hypothetical protein
LDQLQPEARRKADLSRVAEKLSLQAAQKEIRGEARKGSKELELRAPGAGPFALGPSPCTERIERNETYEAFSTAC